MKKSSANSAPYFAGAADFTLESLELAPHERVIWTGRCDSVWRYVGKAAPKTAIGLALILFVLAWTAAVVHGGNNNWDRGKVVAPFAAHNVLIAVLADLWLIPPSLYLLLWPIWVWRGLIRSSYIVTDRRGVIVEPSFLGRLKTQSFYPDALRSMRVEGYPDGTGDLIFGEPPSAMSLERATGFFGIHEPREIETLLQKTLPMHEILENQPADTRF